MRFTVSHYLARLYRISDTHSIIKYLDSILMIANFPMCMLFSWGEYWMAENTDMDRNSCKFGLEGAEIIVKVDVSWVTKMFSETFFISRLLKDLWGNGGVQKNINLSTRMCLLYQL